MTMIKPLKQPLLHSMLLQPVMGREVTKHEYRWEVGSRSHLSRDALDVLLKDSQLQGVAKFNRQKIRFG